MDGDERALPARILCGMGNVSGEDEKSGEAQTAPRLRLRPVYVKVEETNEVGVVLRVPLNLNPDRKVHFVTDRGRYAMIVPPGMCSGQKIQVRQPERVAAADRALQEAAASDDIATQLGDLGEE